MTDAKPEEGAIVIGAGVTFKGEVVVPGLASINGTFEGTLQAADLIVGDSGRVSGFISVETADVRGIVAESLTVRSKLTLRSSGSISGSMTYAKITVEEGGVLAGSIEKIESRTEPEDHARTTEEMAQETPKPARDQATPAHFAMADDDQPEVNNGASYFMAAAAGE